MGLKFPGLGDERGDASVFLSMILALSVGTAVYYNMDKMNQTLKSAKVTGEKQKAETRNLSSLSMAVALMSYTGANPQSDDLNALPYIYPDNYFPGDKIGTTRPAPGVSTWSFSNMKLEVKSPADANLKSSDFAAYVAGGSRPALTNTATITFLKPIYAPSPNSALIKAYEAEVTSRSFDNQQLVSKATIPVPPPLPPKCILSSVDGQVNFQPNTPMTLELLVSGVALEARVPETDKALLAPAGEFADHTVRELDKTSAGYSVRRINARVGNPWTVTTPRPLLAVDGTSYVEFETFAYLRTVDNESEKGVSCSFKYKVAPPAFCKLWTDKASVTPGQCVNITSETKGPVVPNSLVMSAVDPTGKAIGGLTQNGSKGAFCTPSVSNYTADVVVPQEIRDEYYPALSQLNTDQKKALFEELGILSAILKSVFKNEPLLQTLSIHQYNALTLLTPAEIQSIETLDFSTITHLNTLSPEQIAALRGMKENDFRDVIGAQGRDLSTIALLKDLDPAVLNKLASYNSLLLRSYIASLLTEAANSAAEPVNYRILGTVTANDGSKNTCLVHVTAGMNKCPFFGDQYPNYGQKQPLTVLSNGHVGHMTLDFKPVSPNWEVAGIASSPTTMSACPSGARCFAVDIGGNRTPFTVVNSADTAACEALTELRQDLGCFEANTKIRMADGSDKPIHQLKLDDQVWNPIRQKAMPIRRITPGPEKIPLWSIQTEAGQVRVTSKHPFLTPTGIKAAEQLKAGDRIFGANGEETIRTVMEEKSPPAEWVWNFEMATDSKDPADHAILADGVVTGDLYLQEQLAKSQSEKLSQLKP
ncbi:Hint domain-containing protein [Oligoflexus tunisiensis]|uniref:Hint domain-containing protein n=1 Tax=Oligoflexus tunisiensis TaxID=708132 RepID=UPI00114C8A9C|nr:Hint domain-containing protein [Oligoflexus tunisiensis]